MPDDENVSREHGNMLNALEKRIRIEECSKHRTYFQKKLSELEKKLAEQYEILKDLGFPMVNKSEALERIETLEKIVGEPNFYKKSIGDNIDLINSKISELREALKAHSKWQKEQYSLRDMEISELHTQINNNAIEIHKRCRNIEEILREFNEALLGKNIIGISFYKDIKKKLYGKDGEKPHETLEMKGSEKANLGMKVIEDSKPSKPTEHEHIWGNTSLDMERGVYKTCMICGKTKSKPETIEVKKADLEFLFKYGDGNYESCGHDDDDFNDLKKKYLEDADD